MAMTTSPNSFADNEVANEEDVALVAHHLDDIRRRLGTSTAAVLAVTKTYGDRAISAALSAGVSGLGENYATELAAKADRWPHAPWHFIGNLQSRQIAVVASSAQVISGVARLKEIDRLAVLGYRGLIDLQVDVTGQPQRHGAPVEDIPGLLEAAIERGLQVRGLMTVADPVDPERGFRATRLLADSLGLEGCSMGMSDDFEVAADCGSTEIRVGSLLFGRRNPRHAGDLT
jgi:uncharacterized pyridoxal phosphate-containing UPF0001 family protein